MRHASFTTRSLFAATVLLVATGSAGLALAHSSDTRVATQSLVEPALVEVPECWGSHPTPVSTIPGDKVETITLTIEPTALVKVDAGGRVLAAETNTGCAPRTGDHVYLVHTDGSLSEAPAFDPSTIAWVGDFTEFGYQPQQSN